MNVELRIEKIERLLSDVSLRRARTHAAVPKKRDGEKAVAGWDSLERGFRAALTSAKRQRELSEVGSRS